MPMVDGASATGVDIAQAFPRMLAFNLFGQATAFFQSAQTLIDTFQPVEALLPLRGLVTIAAHLEQMTKPGGVGLGLAARVAIDSLDREYSDPANPEGLDPEAVARALGRCQEWLDAAAKLGVPVPDEVPAPDTSDVWKSLGGEMRMARLVADTSYLTTGLHVQKEDQPDRMRFRTKLEPGPLTEMIATAAVIAQLEVLKHSAVIFGWTIDTGVVDALLAEARALNEVAANPPETT